ncbi:MAG: hypothetical protein MUF54_18580, partial [Polyangiaceae bacterium]|nr:hypothetical protein [Polyangiaceae bacterium]
MIPARCSVMVLVATWAFAACLSTDASTPPPVTQDAGGGQDADASTADVRPDVAGDVQDSAPEASPDVLQDAPAEAQPEAGSDGAVAWSGPPWFGCTDNDMPVSATVITAFDLADQYFNPEDRRNIDAQVAFPPAGSWQRIGMRVELSCPADGDCDNWDRFASVMLVDNAGTPGESVTELERYITPYNVGMCMLTDVTRFAPRLVGTQTLRSFIDTWVGPETVGHGHGWRVTVQFIFLPGPADAQRVPDETIQLWPYADVEIGNPDASFATTMGTKTVAVAAAVARAEV